MIRSLKGIPDMNNMPARGFNLVKEEDGTVYINFENAIAARLGFYVLNSQGNTELFIWDYKENNWVVWWASLLSECDVHGICGAFGSCDPGRMSICSCLRGYEPRNAEEWNRQNWSSGCRRRKPLQCERVKNGNGEHVKGDGFFVMEKTKVPDFLKWSPILSGDCRTQCLENCSCIAYAYDAGIGCML